MNSVYQYISDHQFYILNVTLALAISIIYSYVELLLGQINVRSILRTSWGWFYLLFNGSLAVIALTSNFHKELDTGLILSKVILSATSALALIRVILVPVKHQGVTSNASTMIDVILNHIKKEYDRQRSNIDLEDIMPIMTGVDCYKAAESLPPLCSALLQTLTKKEGKEMNEEIQKLLELDCNPAAKSITLGVILARYIGVKLLKNVVNQMKFEITIDSASHPPSQDDLDALIRKFS